MIVPHEGTVFTGVSEGDLRNDPARRTRLARDLGIGSEWAVCRQVHGKQVHRVQAAGQQGEGDAMWSDVPGLPLAVFTADCVGVALISDDAVGVAHAGWRGAHAGVVSALIAAMGAAGHVVREAFIGPAIRSCCFEVGEEVGSLFPGSTSQTSWGTLSVDLVKAIAAQIADVEVQVVGGCTRHDDRWFSHRRDATPARQTTLVWKQ